MKWSVKIGEFGGIPVFAHATFFLLLAWILASHLIGGKGLDAAVAGVLFILAIFGCVVLHEFGHAFAARKYGIKTRDITLLPIGGLARLERMPEEPMQEFWVAIAGPAVNVVIAIALFLWLNLTGNWEPLGQLSLTGGSFLERILLVNVSLVVFNILPAFPMDGGRILRALLATRIPYAQATQIAAGVGQGMAFLFGFIGFFTNPFLIFIALFVWIGAAQEANAVQIKSDLAGIPVRNVMVTDFQSLIPTDSLDAAVQLVLRGSQKEFPVVEAGVLRGILTRENLLRALSEGPQQPVGDAMSREFQVLDERDMLEAAFRQLQACQCNVLPVLRRGELVGLLTAENVGEFLMIKAARAKTR